MRFAPPARVPPRAAYSTPASSLARSTKNATARSTSPPYTPIRSPPSATRNEQFVVVVQGTATHTHTCLPTHRFFILRLLLSFYFHPLHNRFCINLSIAYTNHAVMPGHSDMKIAPLRRYSTVVVQRTAFPSSCPW